MTVTIRDLQAWKAEGTRFAMLTAYDFPTAKIFDEAGIPSCSSETRSATTFSATRTPSPSRWRRCSTTRARSRAG